MSLQIAAQHLASRGRGPDTTLVHMAPGEVAGLQALAKAHGGTLTLNPETGLPEAGFLSSILPTIAGAALAATGVGAPMAAMLIGGGMTLATGSLQKGLMAGLGAYGGAGLGAGLMGAGADAAAAAGLAGAEMAPQTAAQLGAGFEGQMAAQGFSPVAQQAAQTAIPAGYESFAPTASNFGAFGEAPIQAAQAVQQAAPQTVTGMPIQQQLAAGAQQGAANFAEQGMLDKFGAGFKALGTEGGRAAALSAMGGGADAAKYGLAALAPALMQQREQEEYRGSGPNPYDFRFDWERPEGPSYDSREALQMRGRLTPIKRMADGGPVSAMTDRNEALTLMANGGQQFAAGGLTRKLNSWIRDLSGGQQGSPDDVVSISPVELPGYMQPPAPTEYRGMTGASADAMKYLMGESSASPSTVAAQAYNANPVAGPKFFIAKDAFDKPADTTTGATGDGGSGVGGEGGFGNAAGPGDAGWGMDLGMEGGVAGPGDAGWGMDLGMEGGGASTGGGADAGNGASGSGTGVDGGSGVGGGYARGGLSALARGGVSHLGDYSDGGRLLRGPGDGVSDSIPATISNKRPARLADGEFVIPARIVSELGNGSTEAGARKLYAMMDRVQKARGKTTGKGRVAVNSRADKALPA